MSLLPCKHLLVSPLSIHNIFFRTLLPHKYQYMYKKEVFPLAKVSEEPPLSKIVLKDAGKHIGSPYISTCMHVILKRMKEFWETNQCCAVIRMC